MSAQNFNFALHSPNGGSQHHILHFLIKKFLTIRIITTAKNWGPRHHCS